MRRTVLVDTGPLVALFDPSDRDHARCREALGEFGPDRLVTTLPVLTEATHLLGFSHAAQGAMLAFVAKGAVALEAIDARDLEAAARLMHKYRDLPLDLADATLVLLAARLETPHVFTLDRRDFSVLRFGRRSFRIRP